MTARPLHDRRILAVEDEYYLAMDLVADLTTAGADVIGPVPTIAQALSLITAEPRIDAAVLDINLGGEMAFPVADALLERGVPFVFTTGYVDGDADTLYPQVPRCEKPLELRKLLEALRELPSR